MTLHTRFALVRRVVVTAASNPPPPLITPCARNLNFVRHTHLRYNSAPINVTSSSRGSCFLYAPSKCCCIIQLASRLIQIFSRHRTETGNPLKNVNLSQFLQSAQRNQDPSRLLDVNLSMRVLPFSVNEPLICNSESSISATGSHI